MANATGRWDAMTNINTVSALDQAIAFLRASLAAGSVAASQVLADAHAQGVAEKTLRRAKDRLGVIVKRVGEKGKRRGFFTWELETLGGQQEVEQPADPVVSPEVPVVEADKPAPVRQVSAPIPERHSEAISYM
ncbi:hypothetical protein ES703_112866 [subsurface metagenome]